MASVTRPAGLVKLMTQASGASAATRRAMSIGDRDGAQAVGDAARADRLLPEHALGQGDPLVGGAALQPADADRGEDEVGAAQRLVEVGGDAHLGRVGRRRRPARRAPARSPRSRAASRSCRTTCGDPALGVVAEQRPVDQRHPESAAAEDRQPHASITSTPASSQRGAGSPGRHRRVGHHHVEVLGTADPRHARCRGTCRRRRAGRPGRWPRSWRA